MFTQQSEPTYINELQNRIFHLVLWTSNVTKLPVAYFTRKVNLNLSEPPLKYNGGSAKYRFIFLVKYAPGVTSTTTNTVGYSGEIE